MLARGYSAAVWGIDAHPVEVEVGSGGGGPPAVVVVGLPDTAVKESRDRVRTAIAASGYSFDSGGRTTFNIAPADLRKEGPAFDLPMALAYLAATRQMEGGGLAEVWSMGELALNGEVRPVRGALAIALAARQAGIRGLLLPKANAREAGVVKGIDILPVGSLREAAEFLEGKRPIRPVVVEPDEILGVLDGHEFDFADVKGQEHVKRAIEVAVSGGHNILMIGPPGSGKSMLAKRIPSIFPPLTLEEALETTRIHSIAGKLEPGQSIVSQRPFRAPHHTISDVGLIGGSTNPSPGEVSLAHHGVLFLDELPEFKRNALEVLRQPLEDGHVTISRAAASMTFPARFMFVCALNPSPGGGDFSDVATGRATSAEVRRYLNRISGPLLDRIDIHIEVPAIKHDLLMRPAAAESSASIRARVIAARTVQQQRFRPNGAAPARRRPVTCNAHMGSKELKAFCKLDADGENLLRHALDSLRLSARAYDRILRVARTIADLAGHPEITPDDLSEAVQYRALDRQVWG